MQVLVAEDNEINQCVVDRVLTANGIAHTVVGNGLLAVEFYEKHAESIIAILMDYGRLAPFVFPFVFDPAPPPSPSYFFPLSRFFPICPALSRRGRRGSEGEKGERDEGGGDDRLGLKSNVPA